MKKGLVVLSLLLTGCGVFDGDGSSKNQSSFVVIDVRTDVEFSRGHVEGAVNIPYDQIVKDVETSDLEKSQLIYVYCASGARSDVARQSLEDAGYTNVVNGGSLFGMRALLKKKR